MRITSCPVYSNVSAYKYQKDGEASPIRSAHKSDANSKNSNDKPVRDRPRAEIVKKGCNKAAAYSLLKRDERP